MSILEAFGGQDSTERVVSGRISRIDGDRVSAVIPAFNLTHEFGPIRFEHASVAAVGDPILIGFDENGSPWVISWDGLINIPGTLPPTGPAGGDLAGSYPNPTIKSNVSLPGDVGVTGDLYGRHTTSSGNFAIVAGSGGTSTLRLLTYQGGSLAARMTITGSSISFATSPTAPTPEAAANDTRLATTAFVVGQDYLKTATAASTYLTQATAASTYLTQATAASTYAPIASPAFTGNPTAPTPAAGDNDTSIATTAFVRGLVGYGTSLPGSPYDGQEYVLVDSLTNPNYKWRFRYNAGSSSAHKWEFIGGDSYTVEATGAETSNGGGFRPAANPSLTVPRSGDYETWFRCQVFGTPAAGMWVRWDVHLGTNSATFGNDWRAPYMFYSDFGGNDVVIGIPPSLATFPAGTILRLWAGALYAWDFSAGRRSISIRPKRVS